MIAWNCKQFLIYKISYVKCTLNCFNLNFDFSLWTIKVRVLCYLHHKSEIFGCTVLYASVEHKKTIFSYIHDNTYACIINRPNYKLALCEGIHHICMNVYAVHRANKGAPDLEMCNLH